MQPQITFKKRGSRTPLVPDPRQVGLDGFEPSPSPLVVAPVPKASADKELEEITAGLSPQQRERVIRYLDSSSPSEEESTWTPEMIAELHMILLDDMQRIADPRTPIGDAIELLCWIFSPASMQDEPFSLKNCLKVVNGFAYRESMPDPTMGQFNVETFRQAFKEELKPWWKALVARQSRQLQEALSNDLDFVVRQLLANPQWANEQVKKIGRDCGSLLESVLRPDVTEPAESSVVQLLSRKGGLE